MKIGASIGFQLIDIFNIMEDTTLTIDEKKQKIFNIALKQVNA